MKNKKILFIIPYLIGGGALKTVANLSREMSKNNDVTIIGIYEADKKFEFDGELIELNMKHQNNIIEKIRDFFYLRKRIKRIKLEKKFDYSISFLVIADMLNVFSKSKYGEKTIISIRNNESVEYKNNIIRKNQVKISTMMADYIVSISKEVEDDLINNFKVKKEKISTIYNPCIINIKNEEVDERLFVKRKTVITLGGLKYQKGQWHLIRAFSKVVKNIPEARLLIFGKGDYKDYLIQLIKDYDLEKNIIIHDYVLNPHDYVLKADIFVFSSLYEGLGNALMEMLKCGVPVISTDYSCGAREILAPNTNYRQKVKNAIDYAEYGVLVPVCDGKKYAVEEALTKEENYLADAIIELLQNEDLKNKYQKQSLIRAKDFEINNIVQNWYDILEQNNI